jgi:hypothetical protein
MEDDKKRIKEPFAPEDTPAPPQIIDPSSRKERGENDRPVENRQKTERHTDKQKQKKADNKAKKKSA